MTTLYAKGLISLEELREIADESLLDLEKFQHSHPEHEEAFEEARRFLDAYARFPGASEPDD
jgi:ferric-dicitrate binding protein FerR (iron transport regulator)